MKIINAQQAKAWDMFTMNHEPVSSIQLMERAAIKCVDWLWKKFANTRPYFIFCGNGNNGGDGLAIARMLYRLGAQVNVYAIASNAYSNEFNINKEQILNLNKTIYHKVDLTNLPILEGDAVVVDALLGIGLNKPIKNEVAQIIQHINKSDATIVAIDVPTGLFIDDPLLLDHSIIKAHYTLKFQTPAYSFMFSETYPFVGQFILLEIGLDTNFENHINDNIFFTDAVAAQKIYKPRHKFNHKGNFGHALLVAGSTNKAGAAILSAKAILRSGCGLLSVFIPQSEHNLLIQAIPEAMLAISNDDTFAGIDTRLFKAAGIGPGLGSNEVTKKSLLNIVAQIKIPVVLDADAINIIAEAGLQYLPANCIVTPHVKELERLCGLCSNSVERLEKAKILASRHQIYIVVKGAHTAVVCPNGEVHFNATGNPGLAKAGSGDVLTGIITSLLAQNYSIKDAAIFGVYLHGLAADLALNNYTYETMLATDVIDKLTDAFKTFSI